MSEEVSILYKDHEGKMCIRRIQPTRIWFGKTETYPENQWLLTAYDVDNEKEEHFSMELLQNWAPIK